MSVPLKFLVKVNSLKRTIMPLQDDTSVAMRMASFIRDKSSANGMVYKSYTSTKCDICNRMYQ